MSAMLRAMLPAGEVEGALQDAWLKVIRSAHGFRGTGLKPYLGSITRSVAVDRLRKGGRTVSLDAGGRVGNPLDIANVVLFLASDEAGEAIVLAVIICCFIDSRREAPRTKRLKHWKSLFGCAW